MKKNNYYRYNSFNKTFNYSKEHLSKVTYRQDLGDWKYALNKKIKRTNGGYTSISFLVNMI